MLKKYTYFLVLIVFVLNSCNPIDQNLDHIPTLPNQMTGEYDLNESIQQTTSAQTPDLENHYGIIRVPSQVDEMIGNLSNIPIETFYKRSFIYWLSRDPEKITMLGLEEYFSDENSLLTNISESYILETEKLERSILSRIKTYDRSLLDVEEQINFDIYLWFWKDKVEGQPFRLLRSPIQSYAPESAQDQFINLMINYHPLQSEQDVIDYISRINQINLKIEQVIDQLKLRAENGIVPPKIVLVNALTHTLEYVPEKISDQYDVEKSILFTHLKDKLSEGDLLSPSREYKYLNQLKTVMNESFIPAFTKLANYLEQLIEISEDQFGLHHFINGEDYYGYLINHYTGSQLTDEQISSFAEDKVIQYSDQLKNISTEVGLNGIEFGPEYISLAKENQNQFIQIYPMFPSLIYNQIRTRSRSQLNAHISEKASISVNFSVNQTGIEQALNPLSIENFQVNDPWTELTNALMVRNQKIDTSLVFSKSITEIIDQYFSNEEYSNLQDNPFFRTSLQIPGYVERWQSYFLEDLSSNSSLISHWEEFSVIQRDLFLSTCLLVDTGIHIYGWTIGESKEFIEKTTGLPEGSTQMIVERIVQNPGQMTMYTIGKQQIQNLVEQLQVQLNEKYDPKDFNDWLIAKGEMPFAIMEAQTKAYITMVEKMDSNNIQP